MTAVVGEGPTTRELALGEFVTSGGETLTGLRLRYRVVGDTEAARENGWILVFHALTGSADAEAWWGPLIGPGKALDTARHAIVSANLLGSCYGSTGPMEWAAEHDEPFPELSPADLALARSGFVHGALLTATAEVLACVALALAWWRHVKWLPALAASIALVELIGFAKGRATQADPALYYPTIPSVRSLSEKATGRIVGFFCLPANLAPMLGFNDVRGYDPVEPARVTELVRIAAHPRSPTFDYTAMQWLAPAITSNAGGRVQLPPILDLLGVRHVICRGAPPPGIRLELAGDDYWGVENVRALPRAFVPAHVTLERDHDLRLRALAAASFDPKVEAYVESPVDVTVNASGRATRELDEPTHVRVAVDANDRALLVLADRWDVGWRATLNAQSVPIVIADHALRGVVVPAGHSVVDFDYAPASARLGSWCAAAAIVVLAGLCLARRPRRSQSAQAP